jgi:hypothetical protein
MHYVQKKAALAIISMVESGLRELRLMMTDHSVDAEPGHVIHRPKPEPSFGSPLDDEEERSLEQVMEQSRLAMLKQGQSMTQAFYQDAAPAKPTPLGGFFEGDDL